VKIRSHERCGLCRTPYEDDPTDPTRYKDVCVPCNRAEATFEKRFGVIGDMDYVCHELAHFIACFGKIPRYRRDFRAMDARLDVQTVGRAQVHELRTIALEGLAFMQLGWNLSWKRIVHLSWFGLEEAAHRTGPVSYSRGTPVVLTETAARRHVLRYRAHTAKWKVDLLARAIRSFHRGEET
jgi:hypothetical protein